MADLGNNGSVDTLTYYIGAADTTNSNPYQRALYRQLNSAAPDSIPFGFTDFALSYFGAAEDSLTLPAALGDIRQVRIEYSIESAEALDSVYSQSLVQLRFRPKNLDF